MGVTVGYQAQSFSEAMEILVPLLPILIPLSVAQTVLMIVALIHVIKHDNFKVGNKIVWLIVVLAVNLIGPILYFIIGKGEDSGEYGEDDNE